MTDKEQKGKPEKERVESFTENLGDGVSLEMVAIPAGSFMMGSPEEEDSKSNEHPQHRVSVPAFLMGKYPVTQVQWLIVAGSDFRKDENGSYFQWEGFPRVQEQLQVEHPFCFKGDNRPVERVSWLEAVEFCARLSNHTKREYRLPSEAEWEYACRAGTTTPYSFGEYTTDRSSQYSYKFRSYAWVAENSLGAGNSDDGHYPVGQKLPNAFGLYDMHGNICEWCDDDWHENYEGAPTDGRAWISDNNDRSRTDKLLRGGSWLDPCLWCRSAHRSRAKSRSRYESFGFRVVCVP